MEQAKKEIRIVVLGGGESGVGAAALAAKQGFDVFYQIWVPLNPSTKRF